MKEFENKNIIEDDAQNDMSRRGALSEFRRRYLSYARKFSKLKAEDDEKYADFLMQLETLNQLTEQFFVPGEDGKFPVVDKLSLDALTATYRNAIEKADIIIADNSDDGLSAQMKVLAGEMKKILSADKAALDAADVEVREPYTFGELIEIGRSLTVDIGDAKLEAQSGQMSARIPISIDGVGEGFFTKNTNTVKESDINKIYDKYESKYPEMKDVLDYFRTAGIKNTEIAATKINDVITVGNNYLHLEPKDSPENIKKCFMRGVQECLSDFIPVKEIITMVERPNFGKFYIEMSEELQGFLKEYHCYVEKNKGWLGLEEGANIDKRNSAMSAVSLLLGKPGLILEAKPVIVMNNGVATAGTFMAKADGWEAYNFSPENPMMTGGPELYDNPAIFSDIAAIQVIDYICGNVDRHEGNFFMQFGEVNGEKKLIKIVGIDNDMSFGFAKDKENHGNVGNKYVIPENMGVISEEMADAVTAINRDMLEVTLKGYGLSKAEIDAAWERTMHLKETIELSKAHYQSRKPGELDEDFVRIVPKDEWKEYSLKNIAEASSKSQFKALANMNKHISRQKDAKELGAKLEKDNAKTKELFGIVPEPEKEKAPLKFIKAKFVGESVIPEFRQVDVTGVENPEIIKAVVAPNEVLGKASSGVSNSRLLISLSGQGKERKGYFTAEVYTDGYNQLKNACDKKLEQFRKEGVSEEWLDIFRLTFEITKNDYDRIDELYGEVAKGDNDLTLLGVDKEKADELKGNNQFLAKYKDFMLMLKLNFTVIEDQYGDENGIKASKGGSIDKRNTAMYKMNELLGMDIIPYTAQMQVQVGDKITVGTYMENAEGKNFYTIYPDDKEAKVNSESFTGQALKDLADIQILDYICMNVDRHFGNIQFRFDETGTKVLGAKGFDNDFSFGTEVAELGFPYSIKIDNIRVISEQTAEKIRNMDPAALRHTLEGQGLSEKEIGVAVDRFYEIQDKLEQGGFRIVKDAEWDGMKLKDLAAGEKSIFSVVEKDFLGKMPDNLEFLRGKPKEEQRFAKAEVVKDFAEGMVERAEIHSLEREVDIEVVGKFTDNVLQSQTDNEMDYKTFMKVAMEYVSKIKKDLRAADSIFFRSSDQYKDMIKSVNKLSKTLDNLNDGIKSGARIIDKELDELATNLNDMTDKAGKYGAYKIGQIEGEKRGATYFETLRLQAAANVRDAGKQLSTVVNMEKTRRFQKDDPERGIVNKMSEIRDRLKDKFLDSGEFRKNIASLIYLNVISKNVNKIEASGKITTALSDSEIAKNSAEIAESAGFKKMMEESSKEEIIEQANSRMSQKLFAKYVNSMAEVKHENVKKAGQNEMKQDKKRGRQP